MEGNGGHVFVIQVYSSQSGALLYSIYSAWHDTYTVQEWLRCRHQLDAAQFGEWIQMFRSLIELRVCAPGVMVQLAAVFGLGPLTPLPSPSVTPLPSPSVTPLSSPSVTPLSSPSVTPLSSPSANEYSEVSTQREEEAALAEHTEPHPEQQPSRGEDGADLLSEAGDPDDNDWDQEDQEEEAEGKNEHRFKEVGDGWDISKGDCDGEELVWEFHYSAVHYEMFNRSFNQMVIEEISKNAEERADTIVEETADDAIEEVEIAMEKQLLEFNIDNPDVGDLLHTHIAGLLVDTRAKMCNREINLDLVECESEPAKWLSSIMCSDPTTLILLMDEISNEIFVAETDIASLWAVQEHYDDCKVALEQVQLQKESLQDMWQQIADLQISQLPIVVGVQ